MELRFGLNSSRELKNTVLTALARFARWTAGYTLCLVALSLIDSSITMVIMCAAMRDLPCFYDVCVCYIQILNPVSHIFSPNPHTHRTRATLPHTHVCFDRV